jgi:HSP20 family protein
MGDRRRSMGGIKMHKFYEELMRQMEQDSRDWLHRFVQSAMPPEQFWEPLVDIYETRDALKVKVELAGVRAEEVHLELSGDGTTLTLRGVRRDGDLEAVGRTVFHQMEVYMGPFKRTVALPSNLNLDRDAITAAYSDGFLLVTLPKVQSPRPTTSIPVTSE